MDFSKLSNADLVNYASAFKEEEKRRKIAEREAQAELAWKITASNNLMVGLKDARSGRDPFKWALLTPTLAQKLLESDLIHNYIEGNVTYKNAPAANKYEKKV